MYNLLFGKNPNSEVVLAILGLRENDVQRFRDCGFDERGIFIYTRTGGGNREYYPNTKLTESPYYLSDSDDEYDSTYATYHFSVPEELKEDIEAFKDVRNKGISGKLIQHVLKTIEREKTPEDVRSDLWNEQNKLVQMAKSMNIFETNGHTVVPLDDLATQKLLDLMEKADGKQLSYSVMPYKLTVSENVPRWKMDKNKSDLERDMCRVKIDIESPWMVDKDMLQRWQQKFGEKYPKAIKTITDSVS